MDDPLPPSPYITLSVPKDATLATIRSAHRKLVLSCHPDKVQDESAKKVKAEQFHQVQQAYEILSDDKRRQRYDEKVKLEELRAEMDNERGPPMPRRATDYEYGPPRGAPPMTERRGNTVYETRAPKTSRYSDEDFPQTKYDTRTPPKKYDDYYPSSSGRKTSGRAADEKKRTHDIEDDRERRRREREVESFARDQRSKKRDKEKKRDSETKSRGKFSPRVDDDSDSEFDDRRYSSKRDRESTPKYKYEEPSRRSREEPRKSNKTDSYDEELDMKVSAHREYINRSREPVVIEPVRRPVRSRAASNLEPPPPPISSEKRPPIRRTQGSRQPSPVKSTKKSAVSPGISIVDPPPNRKSGTSGATSDARGIKGFFSSSSKKEPPTPRREPVRSATYQPSPDSKQPAFSRSSTAPIDRRPGNAMPPRSSNLKNMTAPSDTESSDSDSDMTDETPVPSRLSPRQKSTSYRYPQEEDKFKLEPEIFPSRPPRDSSPKFRHSSDRPMPPRSSTTTRVPPISRATSYAFPQEARSSRPGFSRTESAKPTPLKAHQSPRNERFFGEVSPTSEAFNTRSSPRMHSGDDGRYTKSYNPRASEEVDRDAYPGSNFHSHRPRMGARVETTY